jgi:hypothetical protein
VGGIVILLRNRSLPNNYSIGITISFKWSILQTKWACPKDYVNN